MASPGDSSLGGRRTSALRGAFLGLVRNTALRPAQQAVLTQNTMDLQPLSGAERDVAVNVIAPMLSSKWPNLPPGEIQAAAVEAADKLTRRDLNTYVTAVRLKANLQMSTAGQQRVAGAAQGRGFDVLNEELKGTAQAIQLVDDTLNPTGGFMAAANAPAPGTPEHSALLARKAKLEKDYDDLLAEMRNVRGRKPAAAAPAPAPKPAAPGPVKAGAPAAPRPAASRASDYGF